MRVFSSKLQYVDFEAAQYRFECRQVPLPKDLLDVVDEDLNQRIAGRIRVTEDTSQPVPMTVQTGGKAKAVKVDEKWLAREREQITDKYTSPFQATAG